MAKTQFIDDISINTIVGAGSAVTGNVKVSGFLRIDGDIDGNIQTQGRVMIGEDARIRGNINASSVSVGGAVIGDIIAPDYVIILSSGMVLGSIITRKLRVDDNVILHGACSAIDDQNSFEEAEKNYHNRQALRSSNFSYSK